MKKRLLLLILIISGITIQDSFAQRYSTGGGMKGLGGGGASGLMLGGGISSTFALTISDKDASFVSYWGLNLTARLPISDKFSVEANLLAHIPQDEQGTGLVNIDLPDVEESYGLYSLNISALPLFRGDNGDGFATGPILGLDASLTTTVKNFEDENIEDVDETQFTFGYIAGTQMQYTFNSNMIYLKSYYRGPFSTVIESDENGVQINAQYRSFAFILGYVFAI